MRADSVPAAASLAFLVAVQVAARAGLTGGGEGAGPGAGQAQPQETAASLREATAGDTARPESARRQRHDPGQGARWSRGDDPA